MSSITYSSLYLEKLEIFNKIDHQEFGYAYPHRVAISLEPGGQAITLFIKKKNPSPEDFDAKVIETEGYKLRHGGRLGFTALQMTIREKNLTLARHIAEKGGEEIVNLVGAHYRTPLMDLVVLDDQIQAIALARFLIAKGANINGAITFDQIDTPLSVALECKKYLLAEYFLRMNAAIDPNDAEMVNFKKEITGKTFNYVKVFLKKKSEEERLAGEITVELPHEVTWEIAEFVIHA